MSAQSEAATSGAVYTRPLPFVRRASDRRIEVFSPKLGRLLSLTSYAAWQLWLALEANPTASTFCERPAVIEGALRRTIDFWVRFSRQGGDEFWLLDDAEESADDTAPTKATEQSAAHSLPDEVRGTALASSRAAAFASGVRRSPTGRNWSRIWSRGAASPIPCSRSPSSSISASPARSITSWSASLTTTEQ